MARTLPVSHTCTAAPGNPMTDVVTPTFNILTSRRSPVGGCSVDDRTRASRNPAGASKVATYRGHLGSLGRQYHSCGARCRAEEGAEQWKTGRRWVLGCPLHGPLRAPVCTLIYRLAYRAWSLLVSRGSLASLLVSYVLNPYPTLQCPRGV